MPIDFIDELKWRGMFYQCTDEAGLRKHLADPGAAMRRAYIGFDPTADSLTIGNMVTIMMLAHFQRAGHAPVVVSGGGTGLIGDPSGKSAERVLMTEEVARHNVERQRRIFDKLLDFSAGVKNRATVVNNVDWLGKLTFIEALRDIGKHFSVNMMIQKDSVKGRLENREQGISYTEFSYMILQSYDYLVLFRDYAKHGISGPVTLQMGGSDQWGNIVAGADLIRRERAIVEERISRLKGTIASIQHQQHTTPLSSEGSSVPRGLAEQLDEAMATLPREDSFGLTTPLITKADGGKFGKTESGAVWMTADRTSPYAFYQFWLNASDEDVPKFLKIFTFMEEDEVKALIDSHQRNPGGREAHRALAQHVTKMLHGADGVAAAENAARALFSGDVRSLDQKTFGEVFSAVPRYEFPPQAREQLVLGMPVADLIVASGITGSRREAKELLGSGSISINGETAAPDLTIHANQLLHQEFLAIRKGKKSWKLIDFPSAPTSENSPPQQ